MAGLVVGAVKSESVGGIGILSVVIILRLIPLDWSIGRSLVDGDEELWKFSACGLEIGGACRRTGDSIEIDEMDEVDEVNELMKLMKLMKLKTILRVIVCVFVIFF